MGPKIIICAHRIETRVALSRGDSARIFEKLGRSTLNLLENQPKGWRVPGQGAGEELVRY